VIHHVFRPDNTLQILEVGSHLPPHATALGKVLLALRDDSHGDLPHDLPQLTRETITQPDELERALEQVRANSWASEREEAVIGEASIAAPIRDRRGEVAGAIGVVGGVERIFVEEIPRPELVTQVREAGRAITRDLGGGR
jgi:DNA-binding IclR family transcriptional regulator